MRPEIAPTLAPPRAPHQRFLPMPAPRVAEGLYANEPEACRRSLRACLPIFAHVGLLVAVFQVYHLEERGFRVLSAVAALALPVHYLLPFRLKKPFFVAASITGLALLFGPMVTVAVLGIGLGLIALTRLPIAWGARVAAIAGVAGVLAVARSGVIHVPWPEVVWPMAGSLFMLRMILYLYELKHAEAPESWEDALAYFFLLPNFYFVHFPVVDYRNFRRGYFAKDIHAIQADGLRMMVRGTVHLLLWRWLDHDLKLDAEEVHGALSLFRFIACNYLLYLRVSGQFHMACGMLHLFGFSLPETHHNYLLASSFTDYWRRVNIYWKDFMVRVVFNPVVFRLKHARRPVAMATATAAVFVVTWLLHAYQMFWIRGSWGFSVPDALFWGILGGLVLVNVQIDAACPRRAKARGVDLSPGALALTAAKTLGTFATLSVLWSLWSSPTLEAWLAMMRRAFA